MFYSLYIVFRPNLLNGDNLTLKSFYYPLKIYFIIKHKKHIPRISGYQNGSFSFIQRLNYILFLIKILGARVFFTTFREE